MYKCYLVCEYGSFIFIFGKKAEIKCTVTYKIALPFDATAAKFEGKDAEKRVFFN